MNEFLAIIDVEPGMIVQFDPEGPHYRVVTVVDRGDSVQIVWNYPDGHTIVESHTKFLGGGSNPVSGLNGWSRAVVVHNPNLIDEVPL